MAKQKVMLKVGVVDNKFVFLVNAGKDIFVACYKAKRLKHILRFLAKYVDAIVYVYLLAEEPCSAEVTAIVNLLASFPYAKSVLKEEIAAFYTAYNTFLF